MDIQSFITNNLAPITGLLFLLIVLIKNETVDKEKKLLLPIWITKSRCGIIWTRL